MILAAALALAAPAPAERRAVLDALRPAVEAQFGAPVAFVVRATAIRYGEIGAPDLKRGLGC